MAVGIAPPHGENTNGGRDLGEELSPGGLADVLAEFDARVILLRRRNRIKLVVSLPASP